MIPKTVHLCWFGHDPYPVEIKVCLDSWRRILPDYKVRVWTYDDAKALNIPFINEALEQKRWAFAADVVRFYALWAEGGVYMDSDVFLYKRFDEFLPSNEEHDMAVTFHENCTRNDAATGDDIFGLQAAFVIGTKGNTYCREMLDYYKARHYKRVDSGRDNTISPFVMRDVAKRHGYVCADREQRLGVLTVYPTWYVAPKKRYKRRADTFAHHRVYGSWRKRKLGRKIEIKLKHYYLVARYALIRR